MEKVPNLDMFTQRHMRKSSSMSKLNHEGSAPPTSSFQAQSTFSSNMHTKGNDYYGQALKILNTDSRINQNLKQIDSQHEGYLKKTNIKKFSRNQAEQQHQGPVQAHEFAGNTFHPQMVHQNQQKVNFGFNHNDVNRQNIPTPVHFVPNGNQVIMHGPVLQFPPQQFVPMGQPNIRIIPPHPQQVQHIQNVQQVPVGHPFQGQLPLQRANSTQNMQYKQYNQPDKVLSSTNIPPNCNNEQDIKVKSRPQENKVQTYTFRESEHQQKSILKKTYNPFLFDASYLLQIKDSEGRLPDITLATNTKQYYEQLNKKKELMEELNEIKESNLIEGQHFLNQLDCLIQQFQGRELTKGKFLDQSEMRSSRRSLFAKVQ